MGSVTGMGRTKYTTYLIAVSAIPMILPIVLLQVLVIVKMPPAVLAVRVGRTPDEMLNKIPLRLIVRATGVADPVTGRIAFMLHQGIGTVEVSITALAVSHGD